MTKTLKDVKVIGGPPPTEPLSMRVKVSLREELDLIAEYDHANNAIDLARSWVVARVSDYLNNPRYLSWKAARAKRLVEEEEEKMQTRIA